jgi:DNA-binding Lrp family transcriptional regulator
MPDNRINERIVKLLKEHPEGLSIKEIANFLGFHRHTVTKYVYQLIGAGIIRERPIGTVKLCYLKEGGKA